MAGSAGSWRLVMSRPDPGHRLVFADPKQAIDDLEPLGAAPPGHESARDRHVSEMDRECIVQDTPDTARGHSPTIRAGILIEPFL
jgi:hypothetical protein